MELREIREAEIGDLLNLYRHLHPEDPEPTPGAIQATWKWLDENPLSFLIGGFQEEQLAVTGTLTVIPNLTRGCRPYGLIENVVTDPAFRRQGFGLRLLNHSLGIAWEKNCYKVMLLTGRHREEVHRFYQSAGFDARAKQAFLAKAPSDVEA